MNPRQKWILIGAGVLWLTACIGGGTVMLKYAFTPGEEAGVKADWPAGTSLAMNGQGDTLVICVHPHCPCTRATVVELNDLMLRLKDQLKTYVLVMKPSEFPTGWENTGVVSDAKRIPNTTVMVDPDGAQMALFGAKTSGQAMLFDGRGKLLFNGGITENRGHIGDNAGLQRITSFVRTGKADKNTSLVFGCPLNAKYCPLDKAGLEKDQKKPVTQ